MQNSDLHDFERFMQQREKAAGDYVRGDATALSQLAARIGDATFYAPSGGAVQNAENVLSRYEKDAKSFAPGGESTFEILQMGASDGLAYWIGFQRATAYIQGQSDAIPFNLRVTEIFRREGANWKLIHRHADSLATEQNK